MSRMMRKFDRDGVVDPEAVELGNTIIHVCVWGGANNPATRSQQGRRMCSWLPPA